MKNSSTLLLIAVGLISLVQGSDYFLGKRLVQFSSDTSYSAISNAALITSVTAQVSNSSSSMSNKLKDKNDDNGNNTEQDNNDNKYQNKTNGADKDDECDDDNDYDQDNTTFSNVTTCTEGYDLISGVCYEECSSGYTVNTNDTYECIEVCPQNWTDMNSSCQPPEIERQRYLTQALCTEVHQICDVYREITIFWGFNIYLGGCPSGYQTEGASTALKCSQSCSDESNDVYSNSIRTCLKSTYDREALNATASE